MAGIDKTYTNSYKEYTELKEWAKDKVYTCPNGIKLYPKYSIYDFWKEEDFKDKELPIMNTSCSMDYFLIKYCPLQFIQDRMKAVYDEDYYNSIKNSTSEYDTFTKEGKYGKHCKVIKKPDVMTKTPIGYKKWFIQLWEPDDYKYIWYNGDKNIWIWSNELGIGESNTCRRFKSIKSVIRNICKWKLPIGTIVKVYSRYVGIDWEFKVTK